MYLKIRFSLIFTLHESASLVIALNPPPLLVLPAQLGAVGLGYGLLVYG
jgi:hypothetical protein